MADPLIIIRYLRHTLASKTKYGIHSPFIYDYVTLVLNDNNLYAEYKIAEEIRKEMLTRNEKIMVSDFGTGGQKMAEYPKKISAIARNSSKTAKYGRLLHRMVKYYKPATILELGTSLGISSIYMASASRESRLITLEGCPNIASIAEANFIKAGMDRIEIVTGKIDDHLETVLHGSERPDFVFFDANHRLEPTLKYFDLCKKHSSENSIFVFDDIHWSSGMEKAWETIVRDERVTLSVDLFWMGVVFFRKGTVKQHFNLSF
ncbi:MAG: class I SAM-dependent methyltransferase [Bacteroidales bacterium]|nr:class I SAM-dependent methyltransferase [Bacteroidales bacterium]